MKGTFNDPEAAEGIPEPEPEEYDFLEDDLSWDEDVWSNRND